MKKKSEPKLNVRRVQKAILKHPDQFRMQWWTSTVDSIGDKAGGCGTTACIGGWGSSYYA